MTKTEYVNGGINKNTFDLLYGSRIVDKSKQQSSSKYKAFLTIREYTLQQQKNIFLKILQFVFKQIDSRNIKFDEKTNEYTYSHNGVEYTFDMISKYAGDAEVIKELLSRDRDGKCNKGSIVLASSINGAQIATGYIVVKKYKVLHSVVLVNDQEKGLLVLDWTENLIMPFKQYKDLFNFNVLSSIDGKQVLPDLERLQELGLDKLDTYTYLTFKDELMRDVERNEEIFRK